MSTNATQDWHVAMTIPQSDRFACEGLRQRGYEAYAPIFPKVIRHFRNGPNRKRTVIRPMFPGYILVRRGNREDWAYLENCPGIRPVHSLLKRGGGIDYAILPPSEVERIKAKEAELCSKKPTLAASHGFKVGQEVRIEEGPFYGFLAQIETLDDDERIGLLMALFGRESRVSLPAETLASVS